LGAVEPEFSNRSLAAVLVPEEEAIYARLPLVDDIALDGLARDDLCDILKGRTRMEVITIPVKVGRFLFIQIFRDRLLVARDALWRGEQVDATERVAKKDAHWGRCRRFCDASPWKPFMWDIAMQS
jgi:hypothetical protein